MINEATYLKIVKGSSLMFKIKSIAPQFFSIWKESVAKKYSNFLSQADLEIIVADMLASFAKGLYCLFKEKNKESSRIDLAPKKRSILETKNGSKLQNLLA